MKLKAKFLCALVALVFVVTACGTADEMNTESVNLDDSQNVTVEKEETDVVASVPEYTEEELTWLNRVMPNVQDSLNVRAEASEEAEIAGKLEKGDYAEVLELGTEWTKIQSGELVGYIKNEYCIYGLEALTYAKENCDTIATTTTDGLRIREEMTTESNAIKRLDEGDRLVVDLSAEVEDGWVAIKYNDNTYYVSAEYVSVELEVGTGLTMAEIEEIRRQEEEAKAAAEAARAEAAARAAAQQASIASVDDLTLLASMIYCEAGGEGYDTQLAVGAVIMNRVRSGGYPNTIYGVVTQSGQFPPATNGKLARVIANGKATASCYEAAQAALNGADNTGGCLKFNDHNGSRQGVVIGGMVFW